MERQATPISRADMRHETQHLNNARITRKYERDMSNKSGKQQHVLDGFATRGALGTLRDSSDASGYKVCGVMTMSELLESSEGLIEPENVRIMDARRWEEGARSRQTREAGSKTTM